MAITPEAKSSYLQNLPAIFSEHPFLGRYLLAFEQVLTGLDGTDVEPKQGLEEIIADVYTLFDPAETHDNFLPWLASWVALSLRSDWTTDQQREFLSRIVPLYRFRGTKDNLIELLTIYTGLQPVITEVEEALQIGVHSTIGVDTLIGGSAPHFFHVKIRLPRPDVDTLNKQVNIVKSLLDLQKPAHTTYALSVVSEGTIQIGKMDSSILGVNTLLGTIPENTGGS